MTVMTAYTFHSRGLASRCTLDQVKLSVWISIMAKMPTINMHEQAEKATTTTKKNTYYMITDLIL